MDHIIIFIFNPLIPNVGYLTCRVAPLKRHLLRSPWSEIVFFNGADSCLDRAMNVYSMTPICTLFQCKHGCQTKTQARLPLLQGSSAYRGQKSMFRPIKSPKKFDFLKIEMCTMILA